MGAYTVHVVPHAHWDREWYLPFECHRARLVEHMDRVLSLLEQDDYTSYHLDGQMIAVEDYLEIRPEKQDRIRDCVRSGRLKIGPWYVLQDEYLTSGEANVRNLMRGMRMCAEYGGLCRIGYLPDAFGNVGQMPQLLCQAGMTAAAFGRGVTLSGPGEEGNPAKHRPRRSEFFWESPDGSRIPALFFQGWYNNGSEIPVDPEEAKAYWDERLEQAGRYAVSGHLLFLNGSDHQPVQTDLHQALETARSLYPDVTFIQSDLEQYAACVWGGQTAPLETVPGELAGQETAGTNTLCSTASSRGALKALNRQNEVLLERQTEPLLALASMAGAETDNGLLDHAWKLLMQNHPHDSVCGCGIDEVHRETEYRYQKSLQLGRLLVEQAGRYLSCQIAAPKAVDGNLALAVWNTSGWKRTQVVEAVVSVQCVYGTTEARAELESRPGTSYRLEDARGREIPCEMEDLGIQFGFELPDDRFRRPYFERRMKVTFPAREIPAFGYETFYLLPGTSSALGDSLVKGPRSMENRFVRADIQENGALDLTDKRTGRVYRGLGYYEDTGDVGDEYIFRETLGNPITTLNARPEVVCLEDQPFRAKFQITYPMEIPKSADGTLAEAVESMQPRMLRKIGRSAETVTMTVRTILTLEADSPVVRFRTELENPAKDHRLRAVFPTDLQTEDHLADSVFDVMVRPDVPGAAWTNPSRCQRMQYLAAAEDGAGGLAVLNRGVYEYEVLPHRKSLAVTLLRAVGEMGDWGVFPTPEAQCLGAAAMDLGILAYPAGELRQSGCREASQFQSDLPVFQIFQPEGTLREQGSFLDCRGDGLAFTALKNAQDGRGQVLRLYNASEESSELTLTVRSGYAYYRSNILEEKLAPLQPEADGTLRVPVRGKEILTIRFESIG